jgi:DNA-binding NarL/FixJ family response regulator
LIRAIVASDFPLSRDALCRLVGAAFVGEPAQGVSTLAEAVQAVSRKPADLVVVELSAGDAEWREMEALVEAVKPAPVILFALLPSAQVQAAYESGVRGCVPKTAALELVTAALKLIVAGGVYFSDVGGLAVKPRAEPRPRSRLSTRQLEVLKLIEIGQTNKEIGEALGISVATVKLHVQAILNITGARNRTEAALRARGQGR